MINEPTSLAKMIAGLENDYSEEERCFGHSSRPDQLPGGRDGFPALVDVNGALHTGRLALPLWEGTVAEFNYRQWVANDLRDQQRALITRIQRRSISQLPSVSVIVPALGHKFWVLECINAISQQSIFSEAMRKNCGVKCEIIVVQDGSITERSHHLSSPHDACSGTELNQEAAALPVGVTLQVVELSENRGRSTARNIGARMAKGKFLVFLDCRMVLDVHALGEILVRHALCSDNAVMLGFKQNIIESDYFFHRHRIREHWLRPAVFDGRSGDWKVRRDLKKEHIIPRGPVQWRSRALQGTVNFMQETDWLRNMKGSEWIGARSVGHFLSTALVSCSRRIFLASGGFDEVMQDSWGLEDSLIGIRFFSDGGKLVPCPTASAFLVDQPAAESDDR
ncbi:MAG TPA: glycosyltransferase family A protein, partial [Candidatus Angelobacter sp.]|nr:glycosyltransferase family A protein [Candidatus Angelobacter sp.]